MDVKYWSLQINKIKKVDFTMDLYAICDSGLCHTVHACMCILAHNYVHINSSSYCILLLYILPTPLYDNPHIYKFTSS